MADLVDYTSSVQPDRTCDVCGERRPCVGTFWYPPVGDTSACHVCRGWDDCFECEDAATEAKALRKAGK